MTEPGRWHELPPQPGKPVVCLLDHQHTSACPPFGPPLRLEKVKAPPFSIFEIVLLLLISSEVFIIVPQLLTLALGVS